MATQTIPPRNQTLSGKPALLQSGGEGAVYQQEGRAIKIYHHPHERRTRKLKAFETQNFLSRLPPNVLGPQRILTDRHGMVTGFEMALLPPTARPLKKLTQAPFCRRHAIDLSQELDLLVDLRHDLQMIHAAGAVVGDLNDHNLFFDTVSPDADRMSRYWIDVDSFQFAGFSCPVALSSFLDPRLYGVTDFATRPVFSRESDWYAFAVLMCKTLLKTHPYGGTHHRLQTLQARATARVSVLHPTVTYPKAARPATILDEALLDYLRRVFAGDHRSAPPATLLQDLRQELAHCPACAQSYAASRPRCPICHKQSPRVKPAQISGALRVRPLLQTSGAITHVFVRPSDHITVIIRQGASYRLARLDSDGLLNEFPLFTGRAGARFGLFKDVLVVNVPPGDELLLLDLGASKLRVLTTLKSERFDADAVFAATPEALYRIANGYVLRGQVRHGRFLEEVLTTAHRRQTRLWASPGADHLAGYHRLFTENQFFTIDDCGSQYVFSPAAPGSTAPVRLTAAGVAWGSQRVAFLWHAKVKGALQHHLQIVDMQGRTLHQALTPHSMPPYDRLDGKLLNGLTLLHPTDAGILKDQAHSQSLLRDLAPIISTNATLHWLRNDVLIQDATSLFLAETR